LGTLADFISDVSRSRPNHPDRYRKSLLEMAREWMAVAMHEENVPDPKSGLGRQAVIRERQKCQPRL
jgi:hypothetical protein